MPSNRQTVIAGSIAYSILHSEDGSRTTLWQSVPSFFCTHWLIFNRASEDVFSALRKCWQIAEEDYRKSFDGEDALQAMGDMGYSGSTFFTTADSAYLVKSVPRHFEHSFFKNDLIQPYAEHMQNNPSSLLVRITDFLECRRQSIGSISGMAPSHHLVMENIMYGQEAGSRSDKTGEGKEWQSWDLKPMSYFYPERDVAGGALTSEATKSKLADDFDETIVLSLDQAEEFKALLQRDTKLLEKSNAVDYSLFLVRIPAEHSDDLHTSPDEPVPPAQPPFAPPSPPSWRTGITSADNKYVYRASILDFFWAKHKVHAKAMTGLIKTYNIIDRKGPMSVTTTSDEYRKRFLKMCEDIIEVKNDTNGEV